MKALFALLIIMLAVQVSQAASPYPPTMEGDERQVRTSSSPEWLAAVGRFVINKRDGTGAKLCTAFLVSANSTDDSRIIMSEGHCINEWHVSGAAGNRRFSMTTHNIYFTTNTGEELKRKVVAVVGYEWSPGDHAILILDKGIYNYEIKPLVHSDEPFKNMGYGLLDDPVYQQEFKPFATAAGYSSDVPLGDGGKHLTYDEDCYLNGGVNYQKDSRCTSYRGASGGPIVVTVDRGVDEWEERPVMGIEHLVVGIIKGGRDGDNSSTYWTPHSYYRAKLLEVFARYGVKRNY